MHRRFLFLAGEVALVLGLLVAACSIFGESAAEADFNGDEGRQMWTSRYFTYLFIERDLTRPEWGDNYWTHTQPMLTRYIVGGWLWVRGYTVDQMPLPYDFSRTYRENRRDGRVPDRALLVEARAPMVALAAGSIVLLYVLGRVLGGPLAGFGAAGLTLESPLAREHLAQAVSQAPLAFFMLLGLTLGVLGARRAGGSPSPPWAAAMGLSLGLALASKLTAALSIGATLGWALFVAAAAWRARDGAAARPRKALSAAGGWALAVAVAYGVFVLTNPHLYPNPLEHTRHLFERRAREMSHQQALVDPKHVIDEPRQQPKYVLRHSFPDDSLGSVGRFPVRAVLASVGVVMLLVAWRRVGHTSAHGLVLLTILAYFVGISATITLAFDRYLVPTLILGALLSGLGLSGLLRGLWNAARLGRQWRLRKAAPSRHVEAPLAS